MEDELPVRSTGDPETIAAAFVYLMSNPYTTGINLVIDGGLSVI